MKKLLLFAVAALTIFVSCDDKPKPEEPKPFPVGSWRTDHQYFNLTVDEAHPEYLEEMLEEELSGAVTEEESYRLTFNEDGTGSGSGVFPDGTGRYDFEFTWQLSNDGQEITVTGSGDTDMFFYNYAIIDPDDLISGEPVLEERMDAWGKIAWEVEESSVEKMVLSFHFQIENHITEGILDLKRTFTYRYTFEKVK